MWSAVSVASQMPLGAPGPLMPGHGCSVIGRVTELARLRPLMAAFWNSYLRATKTPAHTAADLAVRSAAFAGWHMIDRMITHAVSSVRLSPVHRASAGIGRTILLSPADFTATLGLEDKAA